MKTAQELKVWLKSAVAQLLQIDAGGIDECIRFKEYGIDSRLAAVLINQFSTWLGKPLEQTLLWDHPTIAELVTFVASPVVEKSKERRPAASIRYEEPIAIVGLSCRLPKANDKNAFWELLKNGVSGITQVPADRWDKDYYFDADTSVKGKMNTMWGGFLDAVDQFDPEFFGISPRETNQMDPQQRLMMELSWEALEDAGIHPSSLKGTKAGVFYSAIWNDYLILNSRLGVDHIAQHTATGMHHSIIANRVSYFLGLQGPSMTVDTACSSSLVTVHLAVQSLRRGESSIAMAGGINLMLAPDSTINMTKFGAMAPDGQSKAFDARANGYVRGEGGGVVILKPLSKAIADGDRIYALVAESAVNNDGFSNGLTAPNPKAQEEVLYEAYQRAGIDPEDVHFVETHGTGTILGDPIEAKALGAILCKERDAQNPLFLGSVKTNIGHLEGAAGIAGLIKTALAISHRQIPPNLNFQSPNPNIPVDKLHLKIPCTLTPWPSPGKPAVAGVSSFGFGGTNCHLVLKEHQKSEYRLLAVSADSPGLLSEAVNEILDSVRQNSNQRLDALCLSVNTRGAKQYRAAFVVNSIKQLQEQLAAFDHVNGYTDAARVDAPLAFVCSGQGSQYAGMAKKLIQQEPAFRAKMEACDRLFIQKLNWSVIDTLTGGTGQEDIQFIQPSIFAVQVSLAALWNQWGIQPAVVMGHSMGEVAAAHIAGVLSLEDAVSIITNRSKLLATIAGKGSMALVELDSIQLEPMLHPFDGLLSVAACNSPVSSVVAGDTAAMQKFLQQLEVKGIFNKQVNVDVASHSYQVDELVDELMELLKDVQPLPADIPFLSTVTATRLNYQSMGNGYWVKNCRMPVRFVQAVTNLTSRQKHLFIELSPHPVLTRSLKESLDVQQAEYIYASLERDEDDCKSMLQTLAKLFLNNVTVKWECVFRNCQTSIQPDAVATAVPQRRIFPVSAKSPQALKQFAEQLKLQADKADTDLNDLAYTASLKRMHMPFRAAFDAASPAELSAGIESYISGNSHLCAGKPGSAKPKLVFVFSGQGGQWAGMARDLYRTEPVFQQIIKRCEVAINRYAEKPWSLIDEIMLDHDHFHQHDTERIQPVVFAIQAGLAKLWQSWGIDPDAVLGHSMGEIAAAFVAGAISLEDAVTIICHRGALMQRHKGAGAMLTVHHPESAVQQLIDDSGFGGAVFIAAINSDNNTLVSGGINAMLAFKELLQQHDFYFKEFSGNYAFHSPLMEKYSMDFEKAIAGIKPLAGTIPFYSTVTGDILEGEALNATYWVSNMVKPVRFATSVDVLLKTNHAVFIEIGPTHSLRSPLLSNISAAGADATVFSSLKSNTPAYSTMYQHLAALYSMGYDVSWHALFPSGGVQTDFPAYPFQRKRYWLDDGKASQQKKSGFTAKLEKDMLYNTEWQQKDNIYQDNLFAANTGTCVLFADTMEDASTITDSLYKFGLPYKVILPGKTFRAAGNGSYQINPLYTSQYIQLFHELNCVEISSIVYLGSLSKYSNPGMLRISEMEKVQAAAFQAIRNIVRAVAECNIGNVNLHIVTKGLSAFKNEQAVRLEMSPVLRFARSISLESPYISCRTIDLSPAGDDTALLCYDLYCPDAEDCIVYRNNRRYTERLVKHTVSKKGIAQLVCSPGKEYIITGGLGGLGLKMAGWLVARGAKHLVLTGRSGRISNEENLRQLTDAGATVRVVQADVTLEEDTQKLVASLNYPLGGVIHAAGVVQAALFADQNWSDFNEVLLPKVRGAWNLHEMTKTLTPDFFICISSVSSILGSAKLSSYAAANAFLDSLSEFRRSNGMPCTSINLGPVAGEGMMSEKGEVFDPQKLERVGIRQITAEQLTSALDYMLHNSIAQLTVADFEHEKLHETFGAQSGFLGAFRPLAPLLSDAIDFQMDESGCDYIKVKTLIEEQLQAIAAKVLEIDSHPKDKSMFDSGMDSIMVIEFVKMVQSRFKIKFSPVSLYANPSISQLAESLLHLIRSAQPVAEAVR
jgi:acyl transferase domain-containing protein/acyl carrier protein